MRHGKKFNHLSRKTGHRKAMLRNMASSLILNKRITTSLAKAKALRPYIEPVITKAKVDGMASRRLAFRYLQDKTAVHELFTDVAGKTAERNGGYTRIIKLGTRLGDNSEMALIELVDYNELYSQSSSKSSGKKRRRRGGSKKKTSAAEETVTEDKEETSAAVSEESAQQTSESESEEEKKD